MRKRRRLVNKIMTMSCAVMVAFSAFFYVSMEAEAATKVLKEALLTPNESYVNTGYGMTTNIYAGSDFEISSSKYYTVIDAQNIFYEDTISAPINLSSLNGGSSIRFDGDLGRFFFNCTVRPNSVVSSPSNYPGLDLIFEEHVKECYITINGVKYFGNLYGRSTVSNTYSYCFDVTFDLPLSPYYLNDTKMSISVVTQNYVGFDAFDVPMDSGNVVLHWNVQPSSVFQIYNGNSGSPSGSIRYFDYLSEVTTDIDLENQTDLLNEATQEQTDTLVNGFDNTQGDNVNSDLSAGLNEFQTAEDSLFTTASSGLDDFSFFNFASIPAMVTGMSFVSSIMTSWFNQAGGASGVGIVLSILFSIMLVAMVLGLYRWYQSKGGKD